MTEGTTKDKKDIFRNWRSGTKFFDIMDVYEKAGASDDDVLIKYTIVNKKDMVNNSYLSVMMYVDPHIAISQQQLQFFLATGFDVDEKTEILRKNLPPKDISLLHKYQYEDPANYKTVQ